MRTRYLLFAGLLCATAPSLWSQGRTSGSRRVFLLLVDQTASSTGVDIVRNVGGRQGKADFVLMRESTATPAVLNSALGIVQLMGKDHGFSDRNQRLRLTKLPEPPTDRGRAAHFESILAKLRATEPRRVEGLGMARWIEIRERKSQAG
ncbi:MAG: hypothetical protein ACT4PM_06975 [Gemmatimonadales bacterium]